MSKTQKFYFPEELEVNYQLHEMQKDIKDGIFTVNDIGSILPASVMLHDLSDIKPVGISYMNKWGCEHLGTSVEEINVLGEDYYGKYFVEEESKSIIEGLENYLNNQDFSKQYNFFQRVKLYKAKDYKWFYSVCKLIKVNTSIGLSDKMIILSSPVEGIDSLITRVNKTLNEATYVKNNYKIFSILTNREKTIISMIAQGKSSKDIADELFVSIHTVNTHRKNILNKTKLPNLISLIKFAQAFDLV